MNPICFFFVYAYTAVCLNTRMNSIIILLVISLLFLDVFFSVSNKAIAVVFLAGRVVAGGSLVSPTPVRRCPLGSSTSRSFRRREVFDFEKSSTPEALSKVQDRHQLGRTTRVKVQVHGVAKDGLF